MHDPYLDPQTRTPAITVALAEKVLNKYKTCSSKSNANFTNDSDSNSDIDADSIHIYIYIIV